MKNMKLEERMHQVKSEVDEALVRFFAKKRREAKRIHPSTGALVDQVADLTLRAGKRARPFLCFVGYSAVIARSPAEGGATRQSLEIASPAWRDRNDNLVHAMVGLELFQTFALIHDDIMDESAERRGGKAIHEFYKSQISNLNDQKRQRYGESMAILAGDLAFAWADEQMSAVFDSGNPADSRNLVALYRHMKQEVMYGQALDVMREAGVSDVAQERVDELKTAWYSVVRPLQIGSCLGQFPVFSLYHPRFREFQKMWEAWGVPVGRLFQLRDDVLDGAMDEKTFEKKANVLRHSADQALTDAVIADHTRALLLDIVQFVCTRKS